MSTTLIRARTIVCKVNDRHSAVTVDEGALVQRDGRIIDIGSHEELSARYEPDAVFGSPHHVLLPGFVNSHHHVGLTPLQLGSPDHALELWFASRFSARRPDVYLDTLCSAFEMIASGTTTVQHLHGWIPGGPEAVRRAAEDVMRAYDDIGMRVSYSFALRDQNRLVYEPDEDFVARLPPDMRPAMQRHFEAVSLTLDDQLALFRDLHSAHQGQSRRLIQLAPANLRLRSGVAALNEYEKRGVRVGIGLDEAGINDDRDMLQEMRMVLRMHRVPGMDDDVPTCEQVLRMATQHGAETTPFADSIGTLEVGKAADAVLIDWRQVAAPYLDRDISVVDAVVQRGKTQGVAAVFVAGEAVYENGRFTRVDRDAVMAELAQSLDRDDTVDEAERRKFAKRLFPEVKRFYDGYLDGVNHEPFYRPSARY